jgi:hypothetical protein
VLEEELTATKPQIEVAQQNAVDALKSIEVQEVCEFVTNPLTSLQVWPCRK